MKNKLMILALITGLILLALASTVPVAAQSGTSDKILIGWIGVLSGPEAYDGLRMLEGVKMITEQVNAAGGLLGKQIELKIEDGAGDTVTSANAAEKLVANDKVQALFGAYASTATAGLLPIVAKYQIPLVNCVSQDEKLSNAGNKWYFSGTLKSNTIARMAVPELVKMLDIKKAATLVINADAEIAYSEACKKYLTEQGVTASTNSFPEGTQDFSSILTKLKREAPDTIFINMGSNEGVNFLKQLYQSGLKARIVASDLYQQWADEAGKEIEGMYFPARYVVSQDTPVNKKFAADFLARTGKLPDDSVAGDYDACLVLYDAIKRAGTMEPQALREAILKTNMEITRGNITFDEAGRGGFDCKIAQMQNGELVILKIIPYTGI